MITQIRNEKVNTGLHAIVWKSLAGIFSAMLLVFFLTFWGSAFTVFMLVISSLYLLIYLGLPIALLKTGDVKSEFCPERLGDFLTQPFSTATGEISGKQAWIQICLIPGILLFAVSGIAIAHAIVSG